MFGGALSYCPLPYGFAMFLSPFPHCGLISLRHFLLRQRGNFRNVSKGDVIQFQVQDNTSVGEKSNTLPTVMCAHLSD